MQLVKLVLSSAVLAAIFYSLHLPGALLFGPMVAAIWLSATGHSANIPKLIQALSQALIGCLVARVITPSIFASFAAQWPLFIFVITTTIFASCGLGWSISRLRILPGTTAVWGLLPGAASVMIIMSEEFGADARIVAFMQYLRVVFVGLAASLVALFVAHSSGSAHPTINWFPTINLLQLTCTVFLALAGAVIGPISRVPAGTMLLPLILGTGLHIAGILTIELPQWLLAFAYCILGWSIGLKFTRETVLYALKTLPQTILSIIATIAFCGGLGFVLSKTLNIDMLSAYLATSPGGMDSIAIIAASSKVDMAFVMAMQTIRFLLVLFIGPAASKIVANTLLPNKRDGAVPKPIKSPLKSSLVAQIYEDESELD
jgi:uncharacterized protein